MSSLLFRFCFVCNIHAEQRWYQHVDKDMYKEWTHSKKAYPAPLSFAAGLQRSNIISRKSYV